MSTGEDNNRCRHFNGIQHGECKAGVVYRSIRDETVRPYRFHCLGKSDCAMTCALMSPLTMQELIIEFADQVEAIERTFKGREAVIKATGGERGVSGVTTCPICSGHLKYTVASNGHIWGRCVTTERCVEWME